MQIFQTVQAPRQTGARDPLVSGKQETRPEKSQTEKGYNFYNQKRSFVNKGMDLAAKHEQDIMIVIRDKRSSKVTAYASDQDSFGLQEVFDFYKSMINTESPKQPLIQDLNNLPEELPATDVVVEASDKLGNDSTFESKKATQETVVSEVIECAEEPELVPSDPEVRPEKAQASQRIIIAQEEEPKDKNNFGQNSFQEIGQTRLTPIFLHQQHALIQNSF